MKNLSQFLVFILVPLASYAVTPKRVPILPIVIAIVDTGVDTAHPSLAGHLLQGRDIVLSNDLMEDFHGHGTHISSLILKGSPEAMILPVRVFSEGQTGQESAVDEMEGIAFAVNQNARVINVSMTGDRFYSRECSLIRNAKQSLVVAAAGNDGRNVDKEPMYPASCHKSNEISVAALDLMGTELKLSSNYGMTVDIAAVGENVLGALPGGRYGRMSGTSQATAVVSGAAAAILQINPRLTPLEVKQILMATADRLPSLEGKVASGRLNLASALEFVRRQAPRY